MKSLADFKRRLTPGLSVTVEFPGSIIYGNTEVTPLPGRSVTRRVHSISSSFVVWESEKAPGAAGSRLDWPRADCFRFVDANTVEVSHEAGGKPFATYRFTA